MMEPYDLCVIFANLLKNALEVAIESEEKFINLRITRDEEGIEIYVENSYSGVREKKDGKYKTTKEDKDNNGYGLDNIKNS